MSDFMSKKSCIKNQLAHQFGKNPLEDVTIYMRRERLPQIRIYHDVVKTDGCGIDDITWADLEMDEVFLRINHTQSYIGEQVLYHSLHDTTIPHSWDSYEKMLAQMEKEKEHRLELEYRLRSIGKKQENYYLPEFLQSAAMFIPKQAWIFRVLQCLLVFSLLLTLFSQSSAAAGLLALSAGINFVVYVMMKMKYDVILGSLAGTGRMMEFCEYVNKSSTLKINDLESLKKSLHHTKKLKNRIALHMYMKQSSISGDVMGLLLEYVLGITLIDIAGLSQILKLMDKYREDVMFLYQFTGAIDVAISVASYRNSMAYYCIPKLKEEGEIGVKGLYHPLLNDPVSNDFRLENRAMITRANASGKSTFMKAVAVNAILAQTIHTCCSECFSMPYLTVMTSMAIRDDLVSGESYYVREVRYLKRMLDVIREGKLCLCIIDEILKGTNQRERLAASEAILKYLAEYKSFCIVATHDMELVDKLEHLYQRYYFESHIEEDNVTFTYLLHKGKGGDSNAIALLKSFCFPEEILYQAEMLLIQEN